MRTVEIAPTFESWQAAARTLLRAGLSPAEVVWREVAPTGPAGGASAPSPYTAVARVPREFLDLARQAAGALDPGRWAALYDVLWRLVYGNRDLLRETRDPSVRRLHALAAQARREAEHIEAQEVLALEQQGGGAARLVPAGAGLAELREAAARCTGCDLYRHATQTVFGRGPVDARIVLVG